LIGRRRWTLAAAALAAAIPAAGTPAPVAEAAGAEGFSVRITSPVAGDFVLGTGRIAAEVTAADPELVAKVEFYVDDRLVFIDKEPPYEMVHGFGDEPRSFVLRVEAYRHDGRTVSDTRVTRRLLIHYQTSVDRVILNANALDDENHPVLDLTRDDFVLMEDGVPQEIIDFYLEERPITMAIVLDSSGSMKHAIAGAQQAADGFVDTLRPGDRAMVIDFDEKVFLLQPITDDKAELKRAIDSTYPQGGTSIYDALFSALRLLNTEEGRKAIVLLTDGDDYDSHFSFERILDGTRSSEVVLYGIGLGSDIRKGPLKDLADETGGRAFFPGGVEKLPEVYDQVNRELRSQYFLSYSTTNQDFDGKFRKITLKSLRPKVEIRTRNGYFGVARGEEPPAAG